MMSNDLVSPPFVMPNTLHHGPAELRAAHILYGRVQGSKDSLANVHSMINLARPFDSVIPHMAHGAFAMAPGIVQVALPHL